MPIWRHISLSTGCRTSGTISIRPKRTKNANAACMPPGVRRRSAPKWKPREPGSEEPAACHKRPALPGDLESGECEGQSTSDALEQFDVAHRVDAFFLQGGDGSIRVVKAEGEQAFALLLEGEAVHVFDVDTR